MRECDTHEDVRLYAQTKCAPEKCVCATGECVHFHHYPFFIIGHRYLLMNLHVVQIQYGFELRGLTYSQFVQTFQDII